MIEMSRNLRNTSFCAVRCDRTRVERYSQKGKSILERSCVCFNAETVSPGARLVRVSEPLGVGRLRVREQGWARVDNGKG